MLDDSCPAYYKAYSDAQYMAFPGTALTPPETCSVLKRRKKAADTAFHGGLSEGVGPGQAARQGRARMVAGEFGVSITGIRAKSAGVPVSRCVRDPGGLVERADLRPPRPDLLSTTLCAAARSVHRRLMSRDPCGARKEISKPDMG